MTRSDNSMDKIMAEAERLGKEQEKLDARNRKRRAKGREPLPDPQERMDLDVGRRNYRTGDRTTVDSADAIKLFEIRKQSMAEDSPEEDEPEEAPRPQKRTVREPAKDADTERALREAEAARRVQDMKNGRIDHAGNFSEGGQKLAGGDPTKLVDAKSVRKIWEERVPETVPPNTPVHPDPDSIDARFQELYRRLGVSFEAIESSLSDLQGRVSEIVTATTPKEPDGTADDAGSLKELLGRKTPVVFDVGGTRLTFDAICVFPASPCITVVSRIGSATITPRPGAQLLLTYDMDGTHYEQDPVTYLGTRFDLPMFGLSFVGFIRDREADMIDAAAGVQEPKVQPA